MVDLVTAVIKPHMLDPVRSALNAAGVQGLTITEVRGYGRQGGKTETFRGREYSLDFLPKVKVEVLCAADDALDVVETITKAANTNQIGDGKVWVMSLVELVRVRTGQRDVEAL